MKRTVRRFSVVALLMMTGAKAEVVLETGRFRAVLADDAVWRSLASLPDGRELLATETRPFAAVRIGGRDHPANDVRRDGDRLEVRFAGTDAVLTYQLEEADDWLRLELVGLAGTRPERVTLAQVPVGIDAHVGRRLNVAWDERTAVCLLAADRRVACGASRATGAVLVATAQDAPGPRLEGAAAALLVCPTPELKTVLRAASHAFGLLVNEDSQGVPSKDTELARGAYFFLGFGQADVDRVIDLCRRTGIGQVMLNSGSWCRSPGHYLFNTTAYPDGEAGLKATVDRLHEAGILVGMHTFVSKVSKSDPYVTPVPDRRFWVDLESELAEPVDAAQTSLRVAGDLREWPGSPVARQKSWEGGVDKHRDVIIDDEIIRYESIGPEGRWDTFENCRRGAYGTVAAPHAAGARARHYGVDGCINGYIIDQETDLIDEVAERAAGIFNRCGFDMVYFDGGEDVDRRRFDYYVSKFQEEAVRRFKRRPLIHMGTIMTHLLWHSFTRSSTVDTYLNTLHGAIIAGQPPERWPTVREHIDRSVAYMRSVGDDLMPGELGWFGIWPKRENTDGLQLDEFEYLMARSLAYDAPVSLQTSFGEMEAHPLTPELLAIFRAYDQLRMSRAVDAETRARLAEQGQDFALLQRPGGPRFVPVTPLEDVGGGREVRACLGQLDETPLATVWPAYREAVMVLDLTPTELRVEDLAGETVAVGEEDGRARLDLTYRRYTLFFAGRTADQARALLARATVRPRPATELLIEAASYRRLEGALALGSAVGVSDDGATGDVLVQTRAPNMQSPEPWYAEYAIEVPRAGRWYLWARVRYPDGGDLSFAVLLPDEPLSLVGARPLGNCGQNQGQWHWTGRGAGSTTPPPGQPIPFMLEAGPFVFRVYAREGPGDPRHSPRLDRLCLSDRDRPPE